MFCQKVQNISRVRTKIYIFNTKYCISLPKIFAKNLELLYNAVV